MPENYTFVSRGKEKWASIMLTNGEYEGVIYQYGKVSVAESEDENGNMPLSFKYNVLDYNGHDEEDLESNIFGCGIVSYMRKQRILRTL